MVAPNGARRGKADHPTLPITLPEIVDTARACHGAGADALHLHIRDDHGAHSLEAGRYKEALSELKAQVPGMRIQITTEAASVFDVAAQHACLRDVRPEWASISVREMARDPDIAERVYGLCAAQGTEVQHILYDAGDAALLREWRKSGVIRPGQDGTIFVLGRYASAAGSSPGDLGPFCAALPEADDWMVCAFGPQEHACLVAAAAEGGNVRVGFENSLTAADGQVHADNATSVAILCELLKTDIAGGTGYPSPQEKRQGRCEGVGGQ